MTKGKISETNLITKQMETAKRIAQKRDSGITISTETNVIQSISIYDLSCYVSKKLKQPKEAANARHAKTQHVMNFVLRMYDAKKDWISRLDAARKLAPFAIEEARRIGAMVLRTDRAEATVYEWILRHTQK